MPPNEPVAIIDTDVFSAFGHGSVPAWTALMEGRHAFVRCLRFRNDYLAPLSAALAPELEHETDVSGFFLDVLTPPALLPGARRELFLAATVGEIDRLEDSAGRCTSDSLLERALRRFGLDEGRVVSAACASSNAAFCRAAAMLRAGRLDQAVVFASDSVSEFILSGFATLKAVSPSPLVRPYDAGRDGLLLGDAAGVLSLVPLSLARERDLPAAALITGYGMTCDATHITAPMASGHALAAAVRRALDMAGRRPEDVGAVIGHGTGTIYNDSMEIAALHQVFGAAPPPLLSVKGSSGHTLAAAGMMQLSAALEMLRTRRIPPQTSLRTPERGAETMLSGRIRTLDRDVVLSMNSGFGGLNAVILLEADHV